MGYEMSFWGERFYNYKYKGNYLINPIGSVDYLLNVVYMNDR